jgi:hypothetical protein
MRWRSLRIGLVVVSGLASIAVSAVPSRGQTPSVEFRLNVPSANFLGGSWSLFTQVGAGLTPTALAEGLVPTDGAISISIPTSTASTSATNMFYLRVRKLVDATQAFVATKLEGLTSEQVSAGAYVNFGFESGELAAVEVALPCDPPCEPPIIPNVSVETEPASHLEQATAFTRPLIDTLTEASYIIGEPPSPEIPVLGGQAPQTSVATLVPHTSAPVPSLPAQVCVDESNPCGTPGEELLDAPQCYASPHGTGSTCLVAARDIHYVKAFRGWSERIAGQYSTFIVEKSVTQQWQNGVRFRAGPFKVAGSTKRTSTLSIRDTWPRRGDCWGGNQYDVGPCNDMGSNDRWGRDTWRWERWRTCSAFFCTTDEVLFNRRYDGGTEQGPGVDWSHYANNPANARAQHFGAVVQYIPGAQREKGLENSHTTGGSASVGVNFSNWGSANFSSSMSVVNAQKILQIYQMRSDLPWFGNGSNTQVSGKWLVYDNGTQWRQESWTCEWKQGYTGGYPCWSQ